MRNKRAGLGLHISKYWLLIEAVTEVEVSQWEEEEGATVPGFPYKG